MSAASEAAEEKTAARASGRLAPSAVTFLVLSNGSTRQCIYMTWKIHSLLLPPPITCDSRMNYSSIQWLLYIFFTGLQALLMDSSCFVFFFFYTGPSARDNWLQIHPSRVEGKLKIFPETFTSWADSRSPEEFGARSSKT